MTDPAPSLVAARLGGARAAVAPHSGAGPSRDAGSGALFSPRLASSIAASQQPLPALQERWPRDVELGIATEAPGSIYHGYPYLFLGAFPSLARTPERVEPLALACRLFADSLFVADDVMDEDPTNRERSANVLRIQAMQFEAYRLLHRLFPPEARFWERMQTYLAVYARACLDEKHFAAPRTGWVDLSEAAALSIARGKSSLAKFAVAGLAELDGDESPLEPLIGALGRYYVARQMVDDLTDWREDLRRGSPSLLLARVAAMEFPGEGKEELMRQLDRTSRAIYFGGHGRYVLDRALGVLASAMRLSAPYPDLPWQRLLAKLETHCRHLLDDLDRLTGAEEACSRHSFLLRVPPAEGPWQELAWHALTGVLERWRPAAQVPETVSDGRQGQGDEVRWRRAAPGGDLMIRTRLADALVDADEVLGGQLQEILQGEIVYLLRRSPEAAGWGLSAVFPGLPPDADHLARAMRILLVTGHRDAVHERCEAPLRALLQAAQQRGDGAPPVWIPTPGGEPPPPGGEPDPGVTARLLHALWLYHPERFDAAIGAGVRWLETQQEPDGGWSSPAERGPYETTADILALLASVSPGSQALGRAAAFLRARQSRDGSWGLARGPGDPTSTAIALLGLARAQAAAGDPGDPERANRAWERLRAWRVNGTKVGGGEVLTAAFTLRAALLWHRCETGTEAAERVFVTVLASEAEATA